MKEYNEVQLTKNKMDLNNRKMINHPPSPDSMFNKRWHMKLKTLVRCAAILTIIRSIVHWLWFSLCSCIVLYIFFLICKRFSHIVPGERATLCFHDDFSEEAKYSFVALIICIDVCYWQSILSDLLYTISMCKLFQLWTETCVRIVWKQLFIYTSLLKNNAVFIDDKMLVYVFIFLYRNKYKIKNLSHVYTAQFLNKHIYI